MNVSNPRPHPSVLRKLRQLWGVVRESHRTPLLGKPNPPKLVDPEQLGVTFIGHSSFLIQIAGRNLLVDPVFATRLILLRRQRRPGILIDHLPPIDAVLLTHAHMDHLNLPSLRRIVRHAKKLTGVAPQAIVPSGVRDLVEDLGFRSVTELEWWQTTELDAEVDEEPVTITMTPAQHWGARMFKDTHRLFGGYVISGAGHSIYHSGDTAYFSGFSEIGRRLRPQIALLPIGAYFPDSYRAVHTSPEEALQAFLDLGSATTMVPMHYNTFPLGREPMTEPPIRLRTAARKAGVASQVDVLGEGETLVIRAKDHSSEARSMRSRSA
ncbi:MBL fold metallo-hydrolase [Terriglobus roseus]|uniref:L-ascorbate metabolism protein UlaG, beta-lactamase superfamily n=1 Tax=Terriglobus roseus TaxID=392734 RepID=A0A1H4KUJ0_9BACT|nr:MBL fold metallo-hydrolase [Terriglobus roseus]SEB62194.1 L-ascorbate metabolism protein UlaG, beta-lactamase superfamily [Terriglobus roseus]